MYIFLNYNYKYSKLDKFPRLGGIVLFKVFIFNFHFDV